MKKYGIIAILVSALFIFGSFASADAERRFSDDTSYFGGGLTDTIVTAYSSISAGSSSVSISCYTSAYEIYDVMLYEMELQKLISGQWSRLSIFYDTDYNTDSIYGSESVYVSEGTYRVRTYHYIQKGSYDDETYTTSQSVTVP